MTRNRTLKFVFVMIPVVLMISILVFGSFYAYWNQASPDKTCASCHEIGSSVYSMNQSSHRNMHCKECHGTALNNGIHSMMEKADMFFNHIRNKHTENLYLDEEQYLEMQNNCIRCHTSEFAKWKSGGHSVSYRDIFLNTKHNSGEQLNFDCLRCHGMFFEGNIYDLVEPINIKGPWNLKDNRMAARSAIPCMVCHQVHQVGLPKVRPDYSNPKTVFYQKVDSGSVLSFYSRNERTHFMVTELPKLKLWQGNRIVEVSDDPIMRNCVQCHAPNAFHQSGTSDDRTPRGVHEGLSCSDCHEPHSNNAKKSCDNCHPLISNCKLDVTKMNTSYAFENSPNNIHFVSCADCHNDDKISRLYKFRK
jgi:hypothetical protein